MSYSTTQIKKDLKVLEQEIEEIEKSFYKDLEKFEENHRIQTNKKMMQIEEKQKEEIRQLEEKQRKELEELEKQQKLDRECLHKFIENWKQDIKSIIEECEISIDLFQEYGGDLEKMIEEETRRIQSYENMEEQKLSAKKSSLLSKQKLIKDDLQKRHKEERKLVVKDIMTERLRQQHLLRKQRIKAKSGISEKAHTIKTVIQSKLLENKNTKNPNTSKLEKVAKATEEILQQTRHVTFDFSQRI